MKKLILSAFLALCTVYGFGQARTLTGNVTSSEDGGPMPGVTVMVKGTTIGSITNDDGKYSINFSGATGTLEFSFIGMQTQDIEVTAEQKYLQCRHGAGYSRS